MQRRLRTGLDILMALTFLYLMSYHPGQGLVSHALIGIAFFLMVIVHQFLNLAWYRTLLKGRYTLRRALLSSTALLLIALTLIMAWGSYAIAGFIFDWDFLPVSRFFRQYHPSLAAWLFVILTLHAGLHLVNTLRRLELKLKAPLFYLLCASVTVAGLYSLMTGPLLHDLTFSFEGHPTYTLYGFYIHHLTLSFTLILMQYYLLRLADRRAQRKRQDPRKNSRG